MNVPFDASVRRITICQICQLYFRVVFQQHKQDKRYAASKTEHIQLKNTADHFITSRSIFALSVVRYVEWLEPSCGCIHVHCYFPQQQKDQQKKTKKKLFSKLAKVTRGSKRKSLYRYI